MNRSHFRCAAVLLAAALLAGCSTASSQEIIESSRRPEESAVTENAAGTMPVLSIETNDRSADVLKFVTEPVAPHVSEQIATWTPNYKIPPEPYYEACTVSLSSAEGESLLSAADAEVKVRGNWTTTYDKKPLRLKFAEKQNLLGLHSGTAFKNWVLLAEYKDVSLLRNKTALQLARELYADDGFYAADAQFVEVKINGEYWGVYLLTEQQQVNDDRVNVPEPKKDETGTDTGYFLEFDGYFYTNDPLQQFHVDYADNAKLRPFDGDGGKGKKTACLPEFEGDPKKDIGFTIRSKIRSQEQHDFIASFVSNVYRIMYAAAYEQQAFVFNADYSEISLSDSLTPQEAVERVVDITSLADAYIIAELTCDADLYWSSFFMDVDFTAAGSRRLTFEAPWDFDSALGNKDRCINGTGFYAGNRIPDVNGNTYMTINPWIAVLMYEDWFQDVIRTQWKKLYDSGAFDRAVNMIRSDAADYADAFQRNESRWGICTSDPAITGELAKQTKAIRSQADGAAQLADWLGKRVAFLDAYWRQET